MRTVRISATWGAAVGIGIAVLMISLDRLGPFSASLEGFINKTIFMLCLPYILGFTSLVNSTASLYLVTIAGNAVLYGALFVIVSLCVALFRRVAARNEDE